MSLIDLILNFAGLLLWFNWRSVRFDPLARRKPATLVGTLRSTRPRDISAWMFLAGLPALLFIRAVLYWQIGAAADWVPRLDLGLVVLPFPIERFTAALFFSLTSFLHLAIIAFAWLLVLVIINRRVPDPGPILRLLRLHAGRIGRLPAWVQLSLLLGLTLGLWVAFRPVLSWAGIVNPARSTAQVLQQALLLFGMLFTSTKLLLPVILLLYMLSTYVYLGNSPLWEFVASTSRGLLAPLGRLGLRSAKLDFTPLAGVVIILLLLHTLPLLALRFAAAHNLSIWPE